MKKLLITLLLISPFSFADWDKELAKLIEEEKELSKILDEIHPYPPKGADWGDVFNCKTTSHTQRWHSGKTANLEQETFMFKLEEDTKRIIFSEGLFYSTYLDLFFLHGNENRRGEFRATGSHLMAYFSGGTIQIVMFEGSMSENRWADGVLGPGGMRVITANCDKF